jgi:hypothetical protein
MMRFIRPRLRKPVGIALFGTVYAAWLVHGGNGWVSAIVAVVGTAAFAITTYLRGGRDSDEDALYGSRTDERQRLIAQRSWALAGKVTMVAAFAGVTIAVAARVAGGGHSRSSSPSAVLVTFSACRTTVSEKGFRPMTRTTGIRCDPRSAIDPLQSGSAGQRPTTRSSLTSRGSSDTSGP